MKETKTMTDLMTVILNNFPFHNEFVCFLNMRDYLSFKNFIINYSSFDGEGCYVELSKNSSIEAGFISIFLEGKTIHFYQLGSVSFIGPIKKL